MRKDLKYIKLLGVNICPTGYLIEIALKDNKRYKQIVPLSASEIMEPQIIKDLAAGIMPFVDIVKSKFSDGRTMFKMIKISDDIQGNNESEISHISNN